MLSKMDRREIISMKNEGMLVGDISLVFEVSKRTIYRVLDGSYNDDKKADRMEVFGLVVRDDGCYVTGILNSEKKLDHVYVTPNHEIDWNTPELELEAEQEVMRRLKDGPVEV